MPGLTEKDFVIREDGVPQAINSFAAEGGEALGGGPRNMTSKASSAAGRTFLIVLGTDIVDSDSEPFRGVVKFLGRLRPADRAAVIIWDRVTPFTSDIGVLSRIVERRRTIPTAVLLSARSDPRNQSRETVAAVQEWLNGADEPRGFLRPLAPSVAGSAGGFANLDSSERLIPAIVSSDLLKTLAGIELLRQEPGERRVVLVSTFKRSLPWQTYQYGTVRDENEEHDIAARANDAGVAVDLVNTFEAVGTSAQRVGAVMSGAVLASETGGQFLSQGTVDDQLSRIDERSRYGYIIGYTPTNATFASRRRAVRVDVTRPDVTLAYRRSYTFPRPGGSPIDHRGIGPSGR